MPKRNTLNSEDRHFFSRIAQVTYMNAFDPARNRLLAELAGGARGMRGEDAFAVVMPEMNRRIAELERQGLDTLQKFAGADQPLMRALFLYQIYNRYMPDLDLVIAEHLRNKDAPVPVAQRLIADIVSRGFEEADALHYFACFFQLRRAFTFILGSLVGHSHSIHQLRYALWNNIFTNDMRAFDRGLWGRMEDFSTLLLGETGTGKGSAAAAIGRSVYIPFDRATGRFVVELHRIVHRDQPLAVSGNADRVRIVRPPQGRFHRRGRRPQGAVRAVQPPRRAVPRRNRRNDGAGADQAAAGAAGPHLHVGRQPPGQALRRARDRRDQQVDHRPARERPLPRRPVLPPVLRRHHAADAAPAAGGGRHGARAAGARTARAPDRRG